MLLYLYDYYCMYLVTGSSNDGGEHSSWGVIPSEAGLAHSGAIVDYKRGYVVVTHVDILRLSTCTNTQT